VGPYFERHAIDTNAVMTTRTTDLGAKLLAELGHEPTPGQQRAIHALDRLLHSERDHATLVLKGYAGTGKTTLVGALVKVLARERRPVVLLAPTGRAAKVLSAYAQAPASTIHRRIYRMGMDGDEGYAGLSVVRHKDEGALFVVDEASMIGQGGGEGAFGDRDLLNDLFAHVFNTSGCKLLLIGDPAQLPPVGSDHSPALEVKDLRGIGLNAGLVELTDVVRQAEGSGILTNATALRHLLDTVPPDTPKEEQRLQPVFIQGFADVQRIDGYDLQDALESAYGRYGDDEVCLITRSNKRAFQYSQQVRARIHGFEEELCANDRLMVVRNNYFWAGRNGRPELIANGEVLEVRRVHGLEERYGLRFADVTAGWWNGQEYRELDCKVMVDTLAVESPSMPGPRMRLLQQQVREGIVARTRGELVAKLKEDPYLNALQIKYAYAVTAHKAQGGQWQAVFVDQGYITEEMLDREYLRWLYTAITRASEKLYLLNFVPRFWGEE
jgi:exodeoxyribonuclease-5